MTPVDPEAPSVVVYFPQQEWIPYPEARSPIPGGGGGQGGVAVKARLALLGVRTGLGFQEIAHTACP